MNRLEAMGHSKLATKPPAEGRDPIVWHREGELAENRNRFVERGKF